MRSLGLALMGCLMGAGSMCAVTGSLQNGTTGKAAGNAAITLFQITANGPQMLATVKSGADGSFSIEPTTAGGGAGPKLLQAVYQGVTYSHMIPPGSPENDLKIDVYDSSSKPAGSKVTTHMMLLEPSNGHLLVSESFLYANPGKVTYNDPEHGTLRFFLPPGADGKVDVNVTSPHSVAIRRTAEPTNEPGVYKLDVPIKPGESRIDLAYQEPFTTPGHFETHVFFKDPDTKLLAPAGVTVEAVGMTPLGQEPQTKANIFNLAGSDLNIGVQGSGTLKRQGSNDGDSAEGSDGDQGNAQVSELMPQLYHKTSVADGLMASVGAVKWILTLVGAMLALGFAFLYRRSDPAKLPKTMHEPRA